MDSEGGDQLVLDQLCKAGVDIKKPLARIMRVVLKLTTLCDPWCSWWPPGMCRCFVAH